jgi:hypothetical protein
MAKKTKAVKIGKVVVHAPGKEDDRWRGETDARVLTDAEAIRADAKRLGRAREHLEHAATALSKAIAGTREKKGRRRRGRHMGSGRT